MGTIKVTGHETITGHNGDTFILEGKGASLTIGNNSNSVFIMAGSNQSLTFDHNLDASNTFVSDTKNERVSIRGSNDHIYNPPEGSGAAEGTLGIWGFNMPGSEFSTCYVWDGNLHDGLTPDGHGGTQFDPYPGLAVDFAGDTRVAWISATDQGHYATYGNVGGARA